MGNKESLILEIARFYKGITVVEFNKRFGKYTTEQLARYVRIVKAIAMQEGGKIV